MSFVSHEFLGYFLPVALLLYLARYFWSGLSVWVLLIASLVFCAINGVEQFALLIFSIAFNYSISVLLHDAGGRGQSSRRVLLAVGIIGDVAILSYFKYASFIVQNLNGTFGTQWTDPQVTLPIGISFYTFTQIAFLVDCYRNQAPTRASIPLYALFVTYFPHVVAGPIIHWREMIPQFQKMAEETRQRIFSPEIAEKFCRGFTLLGMGLAKKLLIADLLAPYVAKGYANAATIGFVDAWLTSLAYTFQLYFDFSGYTDIAIGVSLMFGVMLPINFNSPYKSVSIQDFWRRWHMTLSRWLRDYVFIPLGGSRGSLAATTRNLFLTFLIGGLWHGAAWTFVIWGALHGLAIALHRVWTNAGLRMPGLVAIAVTFLFVNVTWVFFRAPDATSALQVLTAMVNVTSISAPTFGQPPYVALVAAMLIAWTLPPSHRVALDTKFAIKPPAAILTGAMIVMAFVALNTAVPSPFLYFNF